MHFIHRKSFVLMRCLLRSTNKNLDNRPQLQRVSTDELPTRPVNVEIHDDRSASVTSSISEAETVIRWQTPPSRLRTPQQSFDPLRADYERQSIGANEAAHASNTPLVVRFDEEQIRSDEVEASKKEKSPKKMDNVSLESGPPTPGTDDTPYIRFAIEQLTRNEEIKGAQRSSSERSSDSYPVERIIPHNIGDYVQPGSIHTREELALARKHRSSPGPQSGNQPARLFRFNATRPLSAESRDAQVSGNSDIFLPIEPPLPSSRYPDLMFIPTILRPLPMMTIALLCVLMIAAIMFCAIYSTYHNGLAAWAVGIYGGRYFVFSFLPQILAAILMLIIQEVMRASCRILPFTLMAMDDAESRATGLFLNLYRKNFLWSRWDGPAGINIADLFLSLSAFTIPLQSCLFSVISLDGAWRWTAVQGIAWTLVAIYIFVLIGVFITALFFYRRTTGLMWDPRSLADIIALLPRSNSLSDYPGTDIMRSKTEIRDHLRLRSDRLGYWRTPDRTQGIFYCLGEEGASTRRYTLQAGTIHEKPSRSDIYQSSDVEKGSGLYNEEVRFHHIPWYLRDTFVIFWAVAAFVLLLALIIVSFLASTAIRKGFDPQVSPVANAQGFSPANFLYSFIPSLLGLFLYLFYQSLDMSLRQLQPWAELGRHGGGTADQSLLSDYTARSPLGCAWSAVNAGHYRVAITSLLSFLFILLPVLAGGLFFALTTPSNEVRMIPNLPAFYILLTSLILYFIGLLILIPNRRLLHLPHGVDCLAEIFSFVYNSQMLDDAALRAPRTQADLATRLLSVRTNEQEARYEFGVHQGRDGKQWMGVERMGRDGHRRQIFGDRFERFDAT